MANFTPKLTKVTVKPDKDGGVPILVIQLETEFSADLYGLTPMVGKVIEANLTSMQLGLPLESSRR